MSVVSYNDFKYLRMLKENVKWMEKSEDRDAFVICIEKEKNLYKNLLTKI